MLFEDLVPQNKRQGKMFTAVQRLVKSSDIRQQQKFSKFLEAITDAGYEEVAEELKNAFNKAGLENFVTGQFPKVRSLCVYD